MKIPPNQSKTFRAQSPWWTDTLSVSSKRNQLTAAKRRAFRTKDAIVKQAYTAWYKSLRKAYRKLLREQKKASWRQFCDLDPNNPFGTLYKLLKTSFARHQPTPEFVDIDGQCLHQDSDIITSLLNHFFKPSTEIHCNIPLSPSFVTEPIPEITLTELENIINYLPKKAPGPDGFTSIIVQKCFNTIPLHMLDMYNACLKHQLFPTRWKESNVIFIPKQGKAGNTPSSLRPICLISIFGKIQEKLILNRFTHHLIHLKRPLTPSNNQYGFVRNKSTEQACHHFIDTAQDTFKSKEILLAVSFDISYAFDSARPSNILISLQQKRCPQYLLHLKSH